MRGPPDVRDHPAVVSLDDYELVRVLARGGMGVVHEAVERATGRRVALKRVLTGGLDADAVARFLVEGRALARLDHPAIVRVHSLGQAPGGPFLVMDLVQGASLERALQREGPLAPERALAITRALASALAHAHAQGVLHRDLKPANVLLDEQGHVRLIDFGLARLEVSGGSLAHLTRTGEVVGTPAFMAPEQADGRPVDARTDVYGLGATLFALLTGRAPFEGQTALAVLHAVLTREPTPPSRLRPALSSAVDALVLACLAKDPARRPASMPDLLDRLERLERAGLDAPRRRAGATALSLIALVAGVGGALALSRPGAPARPGPAERRPVSAPPETSSAPGPSAEDARLAELAAAAGRPAASRQDVLTYVEALTARGRHDDASRALREAPARDREDPEAWLALLRARARLDVELALTPFSEPDSPVAAQVAHALALLRAGRFDAVPKPPVSFDARPDRRLVLARFEAELARRQALTSLQALNAELARDPDWAEGSFVRSMQLTKKRPPPRAALDAEVRRLRDDLGADTLAARLEAAAALADQRQDEALGALDRALGRTPDPHALVARAQLRLERGEVSGAEDDLTLALELEPLLAAAWGARADARLLRRRYADSAADLLQQARLAGDHGGGPAILVTRAVRLLQAGRPAEALESVEDARRTLVDAHAERVRGDCLVALGDRAGAAAAYAHVLARGLPGPARDHELAAAGLRAVSDAPAPRPWTASYLAGVEQEAGDDVAAWITAAQQLKHHDGALEAAEEAASRAVALAPGALDPRVVRAQLRLDRGRPADAVADLDAALERSPDDLVCLTLRATALVRLGRDREAAVDLGRAIGQTDGATRASLQRERSAARQRSGDLPGALADARAALEVYPDLAARVAELERLAGRR